MRGPVEGGEVIRSYRPRTSAVVDPIVEQLMSKPQREERKNQAGLILAIDKRLAAMLINDEPTRVPHSRMSTLQSWAAA
jgi:hypothetical protein